MKKGDLNGANPPTGGAIEFAPLVGVWTRVIEPCRLASSNSLSSKKEKLDSLCKADKEFDEVYFFVNQKNYNPGEV
jgi:hypothetical protein